MPPVPVAPSPPPLDDPEEDGDEAVLYRKGNSSYFTGRTTWVSGTIVLTRSYLVFYPVHFIKTFRIFYRDIDAVADAFASIANTRFTLRTKDGKYWSFTINALDIADTQAVVERIRSLAGVRQTFDPYAAL
jgi:hypothetical protein